MHKAILSPRERTLIAKFLNDESIIDETFRMLKLRVRRNYGCISQDYELLKQVMNKLESSKST
jgi:hypothetical protein